MNLLPEWRDAWRWWSVRLSGLSAIFTSLMIAWPTAALDIWTVMPDAAKAVLPKNIALLVPLALTVSAIYARLVIQPTPTAPETKPDADSDAA